MWNCETKVVGILSQIENFVNILCICRLVNPRLTTLYIKQDFIYIRLLDRITSCCCRGYLVSSLFKMLCPFIQLTLAPVAQHSVCWYFLSDCIAHQDCVYQINDTNFMTIWSKQSELCNHLNAAKFVGMEEPIWEIVAIVPSKAN